MKFQEQQMKSVDNIQKMYNADIKLPKNFSKKDLINNYQSAIAHKRKLKGIEKQIDHRQAKKFQETAQQSLYDEKFQRKEILDKFKDEFRKDYENR